MTVDLRPSTLDLRPSTSDPRLLTFDPRPLTLDLRPLTLDPRQLPKSNVHHTGRRCFIAITTMLAKCKNLNVTLELVDFTKQKSNTKLAARVCQCLA